MKRYFITEAQLTEIMRDIGGLTSLAERFVPLNKLDEVCEEQYLDDEGTSINDSPTLIEHQGGKAQQNGE